MDVSSSTAPPEPSRSGEPSGTSPDDEAAYLLLGLVGPEVPASEEQSSPALVGNTVTELKNQESYTSAPPRPELLVPPSGPSDATLAQPNGSFPNGFRDNGQPTELPSIPAASIVSSPNGGRGSSNSTIGMPPAIANLLPLHSPPYLPQTNIPPSFRPTPPMMPKPTSSPTASSASINNLLNGPSASPVARTPPLSNVIPMNHTQQVGRPGPITNGFAIPGYRSGSGLMDGIVGGMNGSAQSTGPSNSGSIIPSHPSINGNAGIINGQRGVSYSVANGQPWPPISSAQAQLGNPMVRPAGNLPPPPGISQMATPIKQVNIIAQSPTTLPSPSTSTPHATGQRKRKRSEAPTHAAGLSPKPMVMPLMGTFPASSSNGTMPPSSSGTLPESSSNVTIASSAADSYPPSTPSSSRIGAGTEDIAEEAEEPGYRCICEVSEEPPVLAEILPDQEVTHKPHGKGAVKSEPVPTRQDESIQCDGCSFWQHVGCYVGIEKYCGPDAIAPYLCHVCAPTPLKQNAAYTAKMRAWAVSKYLPNAGGAVSNGEIEGMPNGAATPRESGKKTRGGGAGGRRAKAKEAPAATPAREETVPPEPTAVEQVKETGSGDPPSIIPKRKRVPTVPRPVKVKALARESTPKDSSSDISPTTAIDMSRKSPGLALAKPIEVETPLLPDVSPPARLLDFVAIKRSILRGRAVRSAIAQLEEEWACTEQELGRSAKRRRASSIGKGTAKAGAEESMDSPKRGRGQPGLEPNLDVLGEPIPPVIGFGTTFSQSVHPIIVREKDEANPLFPASTLTFESRQEEEQTGESPVRFCPLYGVHSVTSTEVGAYFGEFMGEVIEADAYQRDPVNQYALLGMPKPFAHRVGQPLNLLVDASCYGSDLRFIRSGCHPNVVLRPYLHQPTTKSQDAQIYCGFGVFASVPIAAGHELVLGWDWDDDHVIHLLHESTSATNAQRKLDALPALAKARLAVLAKQVLGTLPSCACQDDRKCALWRLLQLTLPETPKVEGSGRALLGPLIGATRNWRFAAVRRQAADLLLQNIGKSLSLLARNAATVQRDESPVPRDNASDINMSEGEQDEGSVEGSVAHVESQDDVPLEEHSMDVDIPENATGVPDPEPESMVQEIDAPTAAFGDLLTSPLTIPPSSPTGSLSRQSNRMFIPHAEDSGDLDVPMLVDEDDHDGRLSETSTLTEPLTHASDSGEEDGEIDEEDSDHEEGRFNEHDLHQQMVAEKTPLRSAPSFRRSRRVLSPSPGATEEEDAADIIRPSRMDGGHRGPQGRDSAPLLPDPLTPASPPPPVLPAPDAVIPESPAQRISSRVEGDSVAKTGKGELGFETPEQTVSAIPPEPAAMESVALADLAPPQPPPKRRRLDLKKFTQPSLNVNPPETPGRDVPPPSNTGVSAQDGAQGSVSIGDQSALATPLAENAAMLPVTVATPSIQAGSSMASYTPNWWDTPGRPVTSGDPSYFPDQVRVEEPISGLALSGMSEGAIGKRGDTVSAEDVKPSKETALASNAFNPEPINISDFASVEDPWSRLPAALPQKDVPPHVTSMNLSAKVEETYLEAISMSPPFRIQALNAGNSVSASPAVRPIPAGPRAHYTGRLDRKDTGGRERETERGEMRDGYEYDRERESDRDPRDGSDRNQLPRELPRGPRADRTADRGRNGSATYVPPSPAAARGTVTPRGSPFQPRGGGWIPGSEGYRGGRGRGGGEPYRGRGFGFAGRARGSGGGYAGGRGRGA